MTGLRFLGWEDSLEKEMATHPSIFVWKIPWTEELGKLQLKGLQKNQTWLSDWTTKTINHSIILKNISVIISFSCKVFHKFLSKWKSLSRVWLFVTAWIVCPWDSPGPNTGIGSLSLSRGSSRPRIEPRSPAFLADSLLAELSGKAQ